MKASSSTSTLRRANSEPALGARRSAGASSTSRANCQLDVESATPGDAHPPGVQPGARNLGHTGSNDGALNIDDDSGNGFDNAAESAADDTPPGLDTLQPTVPKQRVLPQQPLAAAAQPLGGAQLNRQIAHHTDNFTFFAGMLKTVTEAMARHGLTQADVQPLLDLFSSAQATCLTQVRDLTLIMATAPAPVLPDQDPLASPVQELAQLGQAHATPTAFPGADQPPATFDATAAHGKTPPGPDAVEQAIHRLPAAARPRIQLGVHRARQLGQPENTAGAAPAETPEERQLRLDREADELLRNA